MDKMPVLNVDRFTLKELSILWSGKLGRTITIEELTGLGKQGDLQFVVDSLDDEGLPFSTIGGGNRSEQGMIICMPITATTLTRILESKKPIEIRTFYMEFQGENLECEIYSSEPFYGSEERLRILNNDVLRFEKQHFENEEKYLPPCLDPENEYYAEEIAIAIEAHTAIFVNQEGNLSQSNTQRVISWLEKNYPCKEKDKGKGKDNYGAFYKRIAINALPKHKKKKK